MSFLFILCYDNRTLFAQAERRIMNYETFRQKVMEGIRKRLPEGKELRCSKVPKLNGRELESLTAVYNEDGDDIIAPTVYMEDLFDMYKAGAIMDEVCERAIECLTYECSEIIEKTRQLMDFDEISDQICCRLVNTDTNSDMLAECPHLSFLDLSVVYYVLMVHENNCYRINISNELLKTWGRSASDISRIAAENTRRLNPPVLENLNQFFEAFAGIDEADQLEEEIHLISCRTRSNGAVYMLDKGLLSDLADRADDDLIIIPSSIHEIIAAPMSGVSRDNIDNIIRSVNRSELNPGDYLSDHSYVFSRELKRVIL